MEGSVLLMKCCELSRPNILQFQILKNRKSTIYIGQTIRKSTNFKTPIFSNLWSGVLVLYESQDLGEHLPSWRHRQWARIVTPRCSWPACPGPSCPAWQRWSPRRPGWTRSSETGSADWRRLVGRWRELEMKRRKKLRKLHTYSTRTYMYRFD